MASAPSCRSLARLAVVAALLWLVFARLFLSPLIKSRAKHCLRLPVGRNVTRTSSTASFVLLWSTDAASFSLRSRRCVESILYHHPSAAVRVYSNQLPRTFFAAFRRAGFDIRVHRYNVTELLLDTPAAAWLERLAEWERGPYFYSHVTDAVRLALLFRVGGVYLDTDVILTRPIRLTAAEPLGAPAIEGPPALHDALGVESYADTRTGLPTLNGAIMAFGRGSRFLWNCLHEFAADYRADRWGWNGPELLTRVQARCAHADGAAVQVEPPERFYPIHWSAVADFADGQHPQADARMWATIERSSYAVHVWNRKAANLSFADGSLLYRLHNTFTVLPARERCT